MDSLKAAPLPVVEIAKKALALAWQGRASLIMLLLPATLVLTLRDLVYSYVRAERSLHAVLQSLGLLVIWYPAWTVFAVACHRFVLLEDRAMRFWSGRETRFIGWVLVISLYGIGIALVPLVLGGIGMLLGVFPASAAGWEFIVLTAVIAVPLVYVSARLSVLFPAAAVDERPNTDWAFKITKGNGFRIVVLLGILFAPSQAFHFVGSEAARVSYTGSFLLRFVGNLLEAVGLVGLSLIFTHLSGHGRPSPATEAPSAAR